MAANRRRTERSESAAHSRARRPAAFRARRTPCRAVFCSPLLRTAGRKKAHPLAPLRGGKSPAPRPGLRAAVRKNKRAKSPTPE